MNQPTSSVIICTRNRIDDIICAIKSLKKQTKQPQQLIVIDSSDQQLINKPPFKAIFNTQQFPNTELIYRHTKPGLTYQRNIGISCVTSDITYFFDDDVILDPAYLKQMNSAFSNNQKYMGGMGTVTNMPAKKNDVYRLIRIIFFLQRDYASGNFTFSGMPTHAYGLQKLKQVEVLGGCCMAFRTCTLKKDVFDEKLYGYAYMEDCDISRRISYNAPLFFNPAAKLQHFSSPINRDAVVENRAMYIHNYSYLFFKNMYPRNRLKIIAYCWSIFGLFVEALIIRNVSYLKGYWRGLKKFYGV